MEKISNKAGTLNMNFILRAAEMRAADKYAAEIIGVDSFQLMLNAAQALSNEAEKIIDFDKEKKIVVICGKGNNGGDGLAAAEFLHKKKYNVSVITVFGQDYTNDAKKAFDTCSKELISNYNTLFPRLQPLIA